MRNTGVCKWFNPKKGYGFITRDDNNEDIFVHQTAIYANGFRSLNEGEKVEFEIENNTDKLVAVNVSGPDSTYVKGGRTFNNRFSSRETLETNLKTAQEDLSLWQKGEFNRDKVKNRHEQHKMEWTRNEVLRLPPDDRLMRELRNSVKYWQDKLNNVPESSMDNQNAMESS